MICAEHRSSRTKKLHQQPAFNPKCCDKLTITWCSDKPSADCSFAEHLLSSLGRGVAWMQGYKEPIYGLLNDWIVHLVLVVTLHNRMGWWIWGVFCCRASRSCSCCCEGCLCGAVNSFSCNAIVLVGVPGLWTPSRSTHEPSLSQPLLHINVACCCSILQSLLPVGICWQGWFWTFVYTGSWFCFKESGGHCHELTKKVAKTGCSGKWPANIERDLMSALDLPIASWLASWFLLSLGLVHTDACFIASDFCHQFVQHQSWCCNQLRKCISLRFQSRISPVMHRMQGQQQGSLWLCPMN